MNKLTIKNTKNKKKYKKLKNNNRENISKNMTKKIEKNSLVFEKSIKIFKYVLIYLNIFMLLNV